MGEPHYFVHIPKTGGTSLISVLDRFFSADRICPWQLWSDLPPSPDFGPYDLIRGHFGGGGLKRWLPGDTRLLTLLRDPAALVLSTFGHIRREAGTRFHQQARQMQLGEFIADTQARTALDNRQTAFLSFDPRSDPGSGLALFAPQSARRVALELAGSGGSVSKAERLARAVATLEDCVWFGILERFEESMWLLARYFSAPPVGRLHHARDEARDRKQHLKQAAGLRHEIDELTELDVALYEAALVRFEARLAAAKRHIDLGPDTSRNSLSALEPGDRLRYDFGSRLLGSGWHVREHKHPEGDYFRWTGPEPLSLLLLPWLSTGLEELRIRVVNGVDDQVIEAMTWRINEVPVVPEDLMGSGPVREFTAQVPVEARTDEQLRLEIRLPYTRRLSEAKTDTDDSREVGVAIHWVEVHGAGRLEQG